MLYHPKKVSLLFSERKHNDSTLKDESLQTVLIVIAHLFVLLSFEATLMWNAFLSLCRCFLVTIVTGASGVAMDRKSKIAVSEPFVNRKLPYVCKIGTFCDVSALSSR